MIRINNLRLELNYNNQSIAQAAADALKLSNTDSIKAELYRVSIDARKPSDIHYTASVNVIADDELSLIKRCKLPCNICQPYSYDFYSQKKLVSRPVIVGSGPAGLFCALVLARFGARPIVIERGKSVDERTRDVDSFWQNGRLNTESNVQFGEGGAGTFSDGKLNTGTKDSRARFILQEFSAHGAPDDILISARPHIGTDILKDTVKRLRREIESLGGEFRFETKLTDIGTTGGRISSAVVSVNGQTETIDTDCIVLCIGHSARDTFELLKSKGIAMEQKPFSVGARIEHKAVDINRCQYGKLHRVLPASDYRLSTHLSPTRGVYSFCMCPGGYVVNASSEDNAVCTNGMSLHSRAAENSNSAILVSVNPDDLGSADPLAGIALQRAIEHSAYKAGGGGYCMPVQSVGSFAFGADNTIGGVTPSVLPGHRLCDITGIYPGFIAESMAQGIRRFGAQLAVFSQKQAVLTAAEARSSSPVRIVRDAQLQSVSLTGLYPCGEGAGYAGGIVSAAVDGVKCAEMILS